VVNALVVSLAMLVSPAMFNFVLLFLQVLVRSGLHSETVVNALV
jgi:hypothetical protein